MHINRLRLANIIGTLIIALPAITACSDHPSLKNGEEQEQTIIHFTANSSPQLRGGAGLPAEGLRGSEALHPSSRAYNDTWNIADRVGIYMLAAATTGSSETLEQRLATIGVTPNHLYTTTNTATAQGATLTSANPFYFPVDRRAVNFIAYYPYAEAVSDDTNQHTYPVSVSTTAGTAQVLKDIDLLYHTDGLDSEGDPVTYQLGAANVPLSFEHQLSKVVIRITRNSNEASHPGFNSGVSVLMAGMPTTATFNLATGALSAPGGADKTITPATLAEPTATAASWEAIVVPHAASSYTSRSLTFTFAEGVPQEVCPLPATRNLEAGKVHYFDFQLTSKGVTLVGNTIANWNEDPTPYLLKASAPLFQLDYLGNNTNPGNPFRILTTATTASEFKITTSFSPNEETEDKPDWFTATLTEGEVANGWKTYNVNLTGAFNGGIDSRTAYILAEVEGMTIPVEVEQETLAPASNCYLLAPGETVYIPVSRVAEHVALSGDNTAAIATNDKLTTELLWTDNNNLITTHETIEHGTNGIIKVTAAPGQYGNAGIAVKVDNVIKWSWHIWVPQVDDIANLKTTSGFMDRNLGATTNTQARVSTLGLLYQWGRKDPFPGSVSVTTNGTPTWWNGGVIDGVDVVDVATSIQKPMTFLVPIADYQGSNGDKSWRESGAKTIYDPCPFGYQVPDESDRGTSGWGNFNYGRVHANYGGYYPAAGYRNDADIFTGAGTYGYYWSSSQAEQSGNLGITDILAIAGAGVGIESIFSSYACSVRCKAIP